MKTDKKERNAQSRDFSGSEAAPGAAEKRELRKVRTDRMRYTKNTASSRFALLAIVFNVIYFISLYRSDVSYDNVGTYYYTILIGASIICNLVFMLITFLCSEGVKNYNRSYSFVLIALAALQAGRIFILPMQAHTDKVMGDAQFTRIVIYLGASAACLLVSAIVNFIKSRKLQLHVAHLDSQRVRG